MYNVKTIHILYTIDEKYSKKEVLRINIKLLRQKKGFRQKDLARELDVDRTTVTKWETGGAVPKTEKLPQLAKVLDCTIDELYNLSAGEKGGRHNDNFFA